MKKKKTQQKGAQKKEQVIQKTNTNEQRKIYREKGCGIILAIVFLEKWEESSAFTKTLPSFLNLKGGDYGYGRIDNLNYPSVISVEYSLCLS